MKDRLFVGIYPAGIVYADMTIEQNGDYKRCAFLPFSTLALEVEPDCPAELKPGIIKDAAEIQAKKGQSYQISTSGQTIILGRGRL